MVSKNFAKSSDKNMPSAGVVAARSLQCASSTPLQGIPPMIVSSAHVVVQGASAWTRTEAPILQTQAVRLKGLTPPSSLGSKTTAASRHLSGTFPVRSTCSQRSARRCHQRKVDKLVRLPSIWAWCFNQASCDNVPKGFPGKERIPS